MLKELIKEILKDELSGKTQINQQDDLVGDVCMFRTYSAGVHFGELISRDGKECWVKNARRVWSWAGACSLSQLAMEGSKDLDNCKIAVVVDKILLTEVIEIIPMRLKAYENLNKAKEWKK